MKTENYIPYLERVVLALLQQVDEYEPIPYEHANPDDSAGYFIPYNVKEFIKQQKQQRAENAEKTNQRRIAFYKDKEERMAQRQKYMLESLATTQCNKESDVFDCVGFNFLHFDFLWLGELEG